MKSHTYTLTKQDLSALVQAIHQPLQMSSCTTAVFEAKELHQKYAKFTSSDPTLLSQLFDLSTDFSGKKSILLGSWLRTIRSQFKEPSSLLYRVVTLDKWENSHLAELQKHLTNPNELLRLEIDLSQWILEDLKQLSRLLADHPLHSLVLRGPSTLPEEQLLAFLESLKKVRLLRVENSAPAVAARAEQVTYRNALIETFGLGTKQDFWPMLMKRWALLPPWRVDSPHYILSYVKNYSLVGGGAYAAYLKGIYGLEKLDSDEKAYYSTDADSLAKNHECYTLVNACVRGMEDLFFNQLLEHAEALFALTGQKDFLFDLPLSEEQLKRLTSYVKEHRAALPFETLTLRLSEELLEKDSFAQLLEALKNSSIKEVRLAFKLYDKKEFTPETLDKLEKILKITGLSYPLTLHEFTAFNKIAPSSTFAPLESRLIGFLQRHNSSFLRQLAGETPVLEVKSQPVLEQKGAPPVNAVHPELFAEKIALKKLMKRAAALKEEDQHVRVEIHHVEIEQEQQVEVKEVEEKLTLEVAAQEQENYARYEGDLVDWSQFSRQPYNGHARNLELLSEIKCTDIGVTYKQIQQEWFANLPRAIRYLSPEAAVQVSKNLPAYTALNLSNLPAKFFLKKTAQGQFVLDYDPYAEEQKTNVFTPRPFYEERPSTLYSGNAYVTEACVNNKAVWESLCYLEEEEGINPHRLTNLFQRFGSKGTELFFEKLNQLDQKRPGSAAFLAEHYLRHFLHLDHLVNPAFFTCLSKIKAYDDNQWACLQRFLEKTGSSKHDLTATLKAFDYFWSELERLGGTQSAYLASRLAAVQWKTPPGGNPVVYMERLLTILRNARSLEEQIECLEGLWLDHHGAYYASRYEGFKIVSREMGLVYDKAVCDKAAFNADASVYRVDLQYLAQREGVVLPGEEKNKPQPLISPPTHKFHTPHRFLGLQQHGIKIKEFAKIFDWTELKSEQFIDRRWVWTNRLLAAILFISHERYKGQVDLLKLFENLDYLSGWGMLDETNKQLLPLYALDIKLNEIEGLSIVSQLHEMNSNEFESAFGDEAAMKYKKATIHKLFKSLQTNKYATLRCIENVVGRRGTLLSALDVATYLSQDPDLALVYKDDLLLFGALISCRWKDLYFEGRQDEWAQQANVNIQKIQHYLKQAATAEQPNNLHYALKLLLQSKKHFTYEEFLNAFEDLAALKGFSAEEVVKVLGKHKFTLAAEQLPQFFPDNQDIKNTVIHMAVELSKGSANELKPDALQKLSIKQLQQVLEQEWKRAGVIRTLIQKNALRQQLNQLKGQFIIHILHGQLETVIDDPQLRQTLLSQMQALPEFVEQVSDFEKISFIEGRIRSLAGLFVKVMERDNFKEMQAQFKTLIEATSFSSWRYESLYALFDLLEKMPQRQYKEFFEDLLAVKSKLSEEQYRQLLAQIGTLHSLQFPSRYLKTIIRLAGANWPAVLSSLPKIMAVYEKDQDDELLRGLLGSDSRDAEELLFLIDLTSGVTQNRASVQKLLGGFRQAALISQLKTVPANLRVMIVDMLAKSYAATPEKDIWSAAAPRYGDLIPRILGLGEDNIRALHRFYQSTTPNMLSLNNALTSYKPPQAFTEFLEIFERAPHGKRDFKTQFSVADVERVINESTDLLNASRHRFSYRKQLMEAFLLVNQMGESLAVFNGKPAKDLSNAEIQHLFKAIKGGEFKNLPPFNQKLCALALMREAMYRATGQFPYSTQIIGLIDCLMHGGDLLQNIDTGQGKSLIDAMKATLLYLDSTRVHVTTSSLADAKRDINIYAPFFNALGIQHASQPITSATDFKEYQVQGINYSTFSQLSLFLSRAEVEDVPLGTAEDVVSMVINESDFSILDDRTLYRYAVSQGSGVGIGNEWIYSALNEFVCSPFFKQEETSAQHDVAACRQFLRAQTIKHRKQPQWINRFSNEQLVAWIESAILVNYKLKVNVDYVLSPQPEVKLIQGTPRVTRVARILQKDGKVSPDAQYGNGVQQLLYAYLNAKAGREDYIIEPESKTIISTNNKNLIDYHRHRARPGIIWGSSATVGSEQEVEEQNTLFNFEFSKLEPHQKKQVKFHKPIILQGEAQQFQALLKDLLGKYQGNKNAPPALVFFKDIETAQRFNQLLSRQKAIKNQLFTGVGDEEAIIRQAAQPGMITVTTSALGRNTDVLYERKRGMRVYQGFPDSYRGTPQKGGRTGRQGSPGEVYYYFSAEQLQGKTLEQLQQEMDEESRIQRQFNQELYDVLGFLLGEVRQLGALIKDKKNFYRNSWSALSDELEADYRAQKLNGSYQQERFIERSLTALHRELRSQVPEEKLAAITMQKALAYVRSAPLKRCERYAVYQQKVRLADCTPLNLMANHFSMALSEEKAPAADALKATVQQQLTQTFAELKQGKADKTKNYLCSLAAQKNSLGVIKAAHQEFLAGFLQREVGVFNNRSFIKRWLGFNSHLNRIADNRNYLLLFRALTSIPAADQLSQEEKLQGAIREAITVLLTEYQSYWFVNSAKKQEALKLAENLKKTTTIKDVVDLLAASKTKTLEADIKTNQSSFWRRLKPVNFWGASRFQKITDKALNLTTAFTGVHLPEPAVDKLCELHAETLREKKCEPLANFKKQKNFDNFKTGVGLFKSKDGANRAVVENSLSRYLEATSRNELPQGRSRR